MRGMSIEGIASVLEVQPVLLERQSLTFRQDNTESQGKIIGFSKKIKCLYN
jgi:hypothetical protein